MSEINIPPTVWREFLQTFSERHTGSSVQLETYDTKTGETVASHVSALHGIELDLEDVHNPRINVTVRYDTKEVKHILFRPSELTLVFSASDGEDSLRIVSLNTDTIVRVRSAKQVDTQDVLKTLKALDASRDEAA